MKKHIFITLIVCLFGMMASAQTERSRKIDHTVKDNFVDFNIPVEQQGLYSVVIISPNGEIMSWPIKDKKYSKGQTLELTLNSKYWTSGSYRVQIMSEGREVDTYSLQVGLSARRKAKIE